MGRSDLAPFPDLTHEKILALHPLPSLSPSASWVSVPRAAWEATCEDAEPPHPARSQESFLPTHPSLLGTEVHKIKKLTPNLFNTEISSVVGY